MAVCSACCSKLGAARKLAAPSHTLPDGAAGTLGLEVFLVRGFERPLRVGRLLQLGKQLKGASQIPVGQKGTLSRGYPPVSKPLISKGLDRAKGYAQDSGP